MPPRDARVSLPAAADKKPRRYCWRRSITASPHDSTLICRATDEAMRLRVIGRPAPLRPAPRARPAPFQARAPPPAPEEVSRSAIIAEDERCRRGPRRCRRRDEPRSPPGFLGGSPREASAGADWLALACLACQESARLKCAEDFIFATGRGCAATSPCASDSLAAAARGHDLMPAGRPMP